jgi:IclR family transcriptional regulator, acetate operon repressor
LHADWRKNRIGIPAMEVKQAAQVMELLEYFSARGEPATLAEICRQLGWPKSSAFKLLATLTGRGYLHEPLGRGLHYPSHKWQTVVGTIGRNEPIPPALLDLLHEVSVRTGETAVLASISGNNAYFIEAVEAENPVRYTAKSGKTVPLHVSAVGRALLAQLSDVQRAALLGRTEFKRYTRASLLNAQDVEEEIVRGIRRGYFEGRGELNEDSGGVAISMNLPTRLLAVMVAGPLHRIRPRYGEIAQILMQQSRKALRAMGRSD